MTRFIAIPPATGSESIRADTMNFLKLDCCSLESTATSDSKPRARIFSPPSASLFLLPNHNSPSANLQKGFFPIHSPTMSFSPHSLPSGHFLSLAPTFTSSLTNPSSSSLAPSTSTLASADFEVDVRTGFLPGEPGLSQLPREYAVWERLLEEAKEGAVKVGGGGEEGSGDRWRSQLEQVSPSLLYIVDCAPRV